MSESFYGGKRGASFILRPNQRVGSNGLWVGLGTINDNPETDDTVYAGIRRGDLKPGEYALAPAENNTSIIYRISAKNTPIESAIIPPIESSTPQWLTGTDIEGEIPGIYAEIPNARIYDMYLNSETGNVYKCVGANLWDYITNVKGPQGDDSPTIEIRGYSKEVPIKEQQYIYHSELGIWTTAPMVCDTIEVLTTLTNGPQAQIISDDNNNPRFADSVLYDFSKMWTTVDDTAKFIGSNFLHCYQGGVLPPLIAFDETVTVLQGETLETAKKLPTGAYVILPENKLIRITEGLNCKRTNPMGYRNNIYYRWRGFAYNLPSGAELQYIQFINVAVDVHSPPSLPYYFYEHSCNRNSSGIINNFDPLNLYYHGEPYPVLVAERTEENEISYLNAWELIQDLIEGGQSVLKLEGD